MHRYLRIKGGFLLVTVERTEGKPAISFRHYGTDGTICHEDRLVAQ
jgi:alkaline phosphatase D